MNLTPQNEELLTKFLSTFAEEEERKKAEEKIKEEQRIRAQKCKEEAEAMYWDNKSKREANCSHKREDGSWSIDTMPTSNGRTAHCIHCFKDDFPAELIAKLPSGSSRPIEYSSEEKWEWFRKNVLSTREDQLREEAAAIEEILNLIPQYKRKQEIDKELQAFHRDSEIGMQQTIKSLRDYLLLQGDAVELEKIVPPIDKPPNGLALLDPLEGHTIEQNKKSCGVIE